MPAYADGAATSPTTSTWRSSRCPPTPCQDVVLDCAAKGVHGLVVISSGLRRDRRGGPAAAAPAASGWPARYGLRLVGPELPRRSSTPPPRCSLNASLSPVMPPRGRAGFFCQSGALGVAILENVARRGLGLSTFVSRGQPRRRLRQRPAAVLGGGRGHRGRAALPRVDRQPAQVQPDRPPGVAAQAGGRGEVRPHHPGRPDRATRCGSTRPRQAAVDAMFRQAGRDPGRHPRRDVRRRPAASRTSRCRAGNRVAVVGNSDALGLLAADAAVAVGPRGRACSVALGADATAEDFEAALDAGHRRPRGRRGASRCSSRRSTPPASEVAERARRGRRAVRQAAASRRSSAPRACPSCCGSPTSPEHGGPWLGPVVPRSRGGRPRARPGRRLRRAGRARRAGTAAGARRRRPRRGPAARHPALADDPDGPVTDRRRAQRAARCYGIDLWAASPVASAADGGAGRRRRARLGRGAQGDRRAPAPAPRPRARVAQHRQRGGDARRPGAR